MIKKKFLKTIKKLSVSISLALCITSCVSANLDYTEVDSEIHSSDYSDALNIIESKVSYYYGLNDKVLVYLDKGILEHFAGYYEKSNENLHKAEVQIEKNFTKSISQALGQALINDTVADYAGETYEDIYTNIFKCLNYIHLNKIEDAMVEIRRFDNKMKVVGHEYQGIIDAQKKKCNSADELSAMSDADSEVKFHNSAFARYLSMLLYRTAGDYSSAKIDYEKIKDAFKYQPEIYNFGMPQNLEDELVMPEDKARVNVVCFTGKSPIKVEEVIRLPLGDTYFKFAIPILARRPTEIYGIQAVFRAHESDEVYKLNLHAIESIENIASETYKQHFAAIYGRAVGRAFGKAIKSGVYGFIAENSKDSSVGGLFEFLNFASQIGTEVTEFADTRISRYFPGFASVGGINIPEGFYTVVVTFYDSSKRSIMSTAIPDYEVKAGELNLIETTFQR